jgi:hypothetical protein
MHPVRVYPDGGDVGMTTSKELLEMANTEWKNREERKGIHDRISWTSGWINGYLTPREIAGEQGVEYTPYEVER